ncbi:MAG: phosphoglucosamine mutase [Bacteriovoracales bacterium]|nr:phosphoglucosamine mutase [Bacteriovoracales bacterium]
MSAKRRLFGTDGIRGKANVFPMTCEVATRLGRAITHFFQLREEGERPIIIIGKDTRLSCYMLEQALAAGVCSQGGMAILTGPLPTPGVAFCVQSMRARAGVMISASHNRYMDNGIKIFDRTGHKLPDEVELQIEEMVLDPHSIPVPLEDKLGKAMRLDQVIGRYIVYAKSSLKGMDSLDKMKVVLDCANGASYVVAPMIFSELGAHVKALGVSPNGKNINLNCGSLHPEYCAGHVKKYGADVGLAFDGDADRLTVIDENGESIHGDRIIGLLSRYLLETGQLAHTREIVGTVMSNLGLELYLARQGLTLFRTDVGDRYIVERMRESGALFGGEPSGHLIFKHLSTTGDGIVSALKVLECVHHYGRSVGELAREVPLYPQANKSVMVKKKPEFKTVGSIARGLERIQGRLGERGRVLLRYSGTEPKARVMVEGESDELVEGLCGELAQVIETSLG